MSDAFTCKSYQAGENKTPAHIELLGDKTKRPEPAQHIIEFPGGAIELSRCSDGNYWAHIIVNKGQAIDDCDGLYRCRAEIVGSRIDYEYPADPGIVPIADQSQVQQIAILIRPIREGKR